MEFRYIVALLGLKDEFIDMVVKESPRWAEKRVVTVEKRAGCSLFVFFLPLIPPKRKKKSLTFFLLSVALSDNGACPQSSDLLSSAALGHQLLGELSCSGRAQGAVLRRGRWQCRADGLAEGWAGAAGHRDRRVVEGGWVRGWV